MRIFESRPAMRWLVPVVAVGVVGGTSLIAATATARAPLPERSAAQLLVDLQQSKVDELQGTVVQKSDLGLPELPGVNAGTSSTDLTALISGTHTLKLWLAGPDKARLAILGTFGETDLIRNGTDAWQWSSKGNTATHTTLTPRSAAPDKSKLPSDAPKTPQEAADQVLKALDPTTAVTPDRDVTVAGRDAYELVLTPKGSGSLITQVRIAVDGENHSPLRVQVFASGADPVFEVGYTDVDFSRPDDAQFAFNPPAGVKVKQVTPQARDKSRADQGKQANQPKPKIVGTGWATVVVNKVDATTQGNDPQFQRVLNSLPRVSGTWGSGRLLSGKAFSVVLTDDGRVAAGAVAPETLYKALG